MNNGSYVIITPCRDEAEFARRTLESIAAQTVHPALWVVVDDGSTDETPEILAEYERRLDFLKVIRREDRGTRSVGPGVIDAFYAGLETVDLDSFEFVCKMDLDLDIPATYFEEMIRRMRADERLGTCSGKAYYPDDAGQLTSEGIGDEMSVGAMKFYRTVCFRQIGGFQRQVMWDGIDCHRARMLGWKAESWDEPDIRFVHLRPMGSSHKGIWHGRMRHGFGQYFMGTSLAYMTASAIYRMTHPPVIIGGLGMWCGFVKSMFEGAERFDDPAFRRFLRQYQWRGLLNGKAAATRKTNEERAGLWNPEADTVYRMPVTNEQALPRVA